MANNSCLLRYDIQTVPLPLQVGCKGRIGIQVNRAVSDDVYCREVLVAVPCGPADTDILVDVAGTDTGSNSPDWSATKRTVGAGDIGLPGDGAYLLCSFQPKTASAAHILGPVGFFIYGNINDLTGAGDMPIREDSKTGSEPDYTQKTNNVDLEKTARQFFASNFLATKKSQPLVPCTEFSRGESIDFSWESNGSLFAIYEAGETEPIYEDTQTAFSYIKGITRDTTFILRASMVDFEAFYLYDALTLHVSDPELACLTVTDSLDATRSSIKMLGPMQEIPVPKAMVHDLTILAPTDGYVVGNFSFAYSNLGSAVMEVKVCMEGSAYYNHVGYAMRGSLAAGSSGGNIDVCQDASLCVPVPAGKPAFLKYQVLSKTSDEYQVSWKWVPLGTGTVQVL